MSGTETPAMGGCIGTARDGTSHSGESSDVSGTSKFVHFYCIVSMILVKVKAEVSDT